MDELRVLDWTPEDSDAATKEGWAVFSCYCSNSRPEGFEEIQRVDEAGVFESDNEAIAHVYFRATEGSVLHRKALLYTLLKEGNVCSPQKA